MRAGLLQKTGLRAPSPGVRQGSRLPARGTILQWMTVIIVSMVLGGVAVSASALPTKWMPLLVIAALFPFIAMIVGDVRRLLLAIILLDIPLQMDVNLAYQDALARRGAIDGWNISVSLGALGILYVLWLSKRLMNAGEQPRLMLWPGWPFMLYLAFVALSMLVARDVTLALFEVFILVQMLLLYIYVVSTVRTQQDIHFVVTMLLVGLVLESIIMIGVTLTGHNINIASLSTVTDPGFGSRAGGTFRSPNAAGGYISMLLGLAMCMLLMPSGRRLKWIALLACGLGSIALLLTFSRGAWLSTAVSGVIICFFTWRRGWLSLVLPFIIVVVLALMLLPFQHVIMDRLFGDDGGAAESRVPLMHLAMNIINDHQAFGVGVNNFAATIAQYATPEFAGQWLYTVHNQYLLVWAETGTGGLLSFVLLLVVTLYNGWKSWKSNNRLFALVALGLTASLTGHLFHMLIDFFNMRAEIQLLWLVCALITVTRVHAHQAETFTRPLHAPASAVDPQPVHRALARD
jgi:putative inorganic carbon (HCO3(-)) transporter